jgi:tryptophanyl-tRNA synthetase
LSDKTIPRGGLKIQTPFDLSTAHLVACRRFKGYDEGACPSGWERKFNVAKNRVMSGMRTTGQLHLGHYLGVLTNWLALQETYDCYFMAADWHMLTTGFAKTEGLRDNTKQMLLDWLSVGIEPNKVTLYVQSSVLETAELNLILGMITPVNWLQRDPTLKEMVRELHLAEDSVSFGLLGYPALMSADILGVNGDLVPVGEDQMAHLEISRDIARRFNRLFEKDVFVDPRPLLTQTPVVLGLDGRKMSKSYGNDIKLADGPEAVKAKIMTAITDPARIRKTDPGHPDVCAIYGLWESAVPARAPEIASVCRKAEIGCVQCKQQLAVGLNDLLAPIQERRRALESDQDALEAILQDGNAKARRATQETLEMVHDAMHLNRYAESPRLAR